MIAVMVVENEEVPNSITGTCMIRAYKGSKEERDSGNS